MNNVAEKSNKPILNDAIFNPISSQHVGHKEDNKEASRKYEGE